MKEKERVVCDRCFYLYDKKSLSNHQNNYACKGRIKQREGWTQERKNLINEWLKEKYKNDPIYKLSKNPYIGY